MFPEEFLLSDVAQLLLLLSLKKGRIERSGMSVSGVDGTLWSF